MACSPESLASEIFAGSRDLGAYLTPRDSPQERSPHEEPMETTPPLPDNVDQRRKHVLGLIERLKQLLQDPHEYIHEYVSTNWDHGALYVVLQANILEMIPADGSTSLAVLAEQSSIPASKLLRILRLLSCQQIVEEVEEKRFARTPVSEALISDTKFKAWVEFQLYETRVASASLSDTLSERPNDYQDGQSAFRHAWGSEMYAWHAERPDKAERFRQAMQGVSQSLDPADDLFASWFESRSLDLQEQLPIVEIGGRYGLASTALARRFPNLISRVRMFDSELLQRARTNVPEELLSRIVFQQSAQATDPQPLEAQEGIKAYVIRNMLWNWSDEEAVELLRTFLPAMQRDPAIAILICDGISPARKSFEPHVEQAYRRRDITMMTMHNARQRSEEEWRGLFQQASPDFQVSCNVKASEHVCKALFEVCLSR